MAPPPPSDVRKTKPLCKKREAHRPKKARGALSMQPDDGVDVEDEGDGEDFDEDLEME